MSRRAGSWTTVALVVGLASTVRADSCVHYSDCPGLVPPCIGAFCVGGQCQYYTECDDGDACTVDQCVLNVGCMHEPLCPSDGFVCNGVEHCFAPIGLPPICVPGTPVSCDDHDACTIDVGCTEPGGCSFGVVDCNDGDPCTLDNCNQTTGCTHDPIAGCCDDATDCPSDACMRRECDAGACTAGTPVSCDDGDPGTTDACDPGAGCTHTSPTPPCAPADCPPDDEPCTVESCDEAAGCVSVPVEGFDVVACACRRSVPGACAGETVPRAIGVRSARACELIGQVPLRPKKAARLLRRAGTLLAKARKRLSNAAAASASCRAAMDAQLADAAGRLSRARES